MGLFSRFWRGSDVASAVESVLDSKLSETVTALNSVGELTQVRMDLAGQVHELRLRISTLSEEIELERQEMERERLAVEHKLGLEKMRQQQEAELAAADVEAQRERLAAEMRIAVREAKVEAMEAATVEARSQMGAFLDRQEKMIDNLLDALPTAQLFRRTGVPDVQIGD